MKSMMEELKSVPAKKKIKTSVEYDCSKPEKADEVFDAVNDILINHLDEMAKITFDRNEGDHTCKVELIENA